jgi:hypothetical protein
MKTVLLTRNKGRIPTRQKIGYSLDLPKRTHLGGDRVGKRNGNVKLKGINDGAS